MIPSIVTVIIGLLVLIWLFMNRIKARNKIENAPLGMPVGTVRAYIALLILSFPFGYLMIHQNIPSVVRNTIFVVMAFYFEKRSESKTIEDLVKEVSASEVVNKKKKMKKKFPLYLPKYTVRTILLIMLILIIVINYVLEAEVTLSSSDTLLELLLMISFYIFGMFINSMGRRIKKRNIRKMIKENPTKIDEIIEELEDKEEVKSRRLQSAFSILVLIGITASLVLYTIEYDPYYDLYGIIRLSLRELLLYLLNVYYGFRQ
ncbi:MAG: hypothetical protein GF364_15470 [Candidatus Lokiarchaeota archaeon]|nr:hypothetical protein [Candidatus Lokiarchaeota archaeon]